MIQMARLQQHFTDKIIPEMTKQFGYKNKMQVPRIEKIVINMGVGEATRDKKIIESVSNELTAIAGQKAVVTSAKKSIAGFKLREGMPVGVKVTLRKKIMLEFLDRLVNVALPRIRDFRGLSTKSFDGRGNYALGIKEHIIFPEVNYDRVEKIRGMDICIVTTARTDDEARALLKLYNMPLVR